MRLQRATTVEAPLDDVWSFHSTIEGLTALTPEWVGLEVATVRDPTGEALSRDATLETGVEIDLSMRPFGVTPTQRWTSRITSRTRTDDTAAFVDEMVSGPFDYWRHEHRFERIDDGTRLVDDITYRLGGGVAPATPLLAVGLDPLFRYRHRRTRQLLA